MNAGSDSEEELVVDDVDSTPPPCITIGEDDDQQPIQIRVAVQGKIRIGRILVLKAWGVCRREG